jgi:hypothetical protein
MEQAYLLLARTGKCARDIEPPERPLEVPFEVALRFPLGLFGGVGV